MKCALLAIIVLNLLGESVGFNFTENNIQFYVYENASINSTVGQTFFQSDSSYFPVFQIVGDDGSFSLFVDKNIISIVVKKSLDADFGNTQHIFMIEETTSEKGINVIVNILNINDNAPKFPIPRIFFFITEPMFNGQQVGQVRATDLDNDAISYSFNASAYPADTLKFFIIRNTGIIIPRNIPFDSSIDAEKSQTHNLQVLATDQGQLTGSIEVTIRVSDMNDKTNKFTQTQYSFNVNENADIGTEIGIVSSVDNDITNANSAISYYILSDIYSDVFTVNPNTGIISVNGKIDFEVQKQYGLPICATDKETLYSDARANCTFVQINVINLNDNLPTISPVNFFLTLSEKQAPYLAYQFLGADADGSKPTFEFNTSLTSSVVTNLFNLNPTTGLLTLKGRKFDYDDSDKVNLPYFLYVVVKDSESPFQYGGSSRLIIGFRDTNDNSPKFDNSNYIFTVNENSVVGTVIGTVNAIDIDKTASPRLYFALNNYTNPINVDQVTGVLTVVGTIDYESLSSYNLTICATDQAVDVTQTDPTNEQRVGCTLVTIIVNDLNDNLPYFENLSPNIMISEKSPIGLTVFTFFPKDKDSVNTLQCILNSTYSDSKRFNLDQKSCVLTISEVGLIDYEEKSQFNIYVSPYDGTYFGTEAHLLVYLIDVNDNSPQFSSSVYFFKIDENSAFNTPMGNVVAIDNDVTASNNQVNYFFLNNQIPFGIRSSGAIYVKSLVDYETTAYYNLTVCASDNTIDNKQLNQFAELRIGCTIVNIEINNLNDNKPIFTQTPFFVTIEEKVLIGTSILKLTAFDADGVAPKFVYDYTATPATSLSKFNLTENGDIIVAGIIDYEEGIRTFVLVILLVDGANGQVSASTNVNISLSDVNDNSPVFSNAYHFSVKEGAPPGTPVGIVQATDPDKFSLSYFIMNTQSLFDLNSVSGQITVSKDAVISYKALEYLLTICATDNYVDVQELNPSNERRTTCTVVTITIESETLPKFIGGNFSIQILSSTPIRKMIFQLFVNNRFGSTVIFAFNNAKTSQEAMSFFGIEATNGIIFVSNNLNIATQKSYVIYVIARDNDTLVTYDEALITVTIVDNSNNNFPLYSVLPYTFKINNNESVGYFVGSVYPTNVNSVILVFNILQSQYSNYFAIDNSGKITLIKTFNYGVGIFTIAVCAKDSAADYKKDCTAVDITVQNVADRFSTPVFASRSGIISLYEMILVGTPIFQLAASYSNGIIGYSLNNYLDTFDVDLRTGIITLKKGLNSRLMQKYDLSFTAFDVNNAMVKTDSYQLTIYVFSTSLTGFDSNLYQFQVTENATIGTVVGSIAALTVNNQQVSFFILNNQFSNVFTLSNSGGYAQILVAGDIDREILDKYVLTVCVTDKGSLQGCAQVYITVNDINDNAPKFSSILYRLTISEKVPTGFVLKKFSATDDDTGVNGLVSYFIDNATNIYPNAFYLNSTTGELQVSGGIFDYELRITYLLRIYAFDSGLPPKSNFCGIAITLTDVNDNSPTFTNGAISTTIDESLAINSIILRVQAEDKDSTLPNRKIIYAMPGDDNGYFGIDSTTGDIFLKRSLDVDLSNNVYYLTVVANDQAVDNTQLNPIAESRIGVEVVTIYVNDINDNSPVFKTDSYMIYVPEDVPVGSVLFQFSASDADKSSAFNKLQYIAIEINSEFLMLNQSNGVLTVKKEFNNQQVFTVVAKARDSGMLESNNATLIIYVDNVIGKTIRFNQTSYDVIILENTAIGTKIFTMTATDAYGGSLNNNIVYSIVSPESSGIFDINGFGEITIKQSVDREQRERYEFLVVANDTTLLTSQTSQACALLIIRITDVNDNRPVFTSASSFSVSEKTVVGTVIFILSTVDADANTQITFYSQMNSPFEITPQGNVILVTELDYEQTQQYTLTVGATDSVYSTLQPITVNIINENDNGPVFSKNFYAASITENKLSMNKPFLIVTAVDGDLPPFNIVTYELIDLDNLGPLFQFYLLDSSGGISYKGTFDREVKEFYRFLVKATNTGNPTRSAITYVEVTILDENDYPPIVTPSYNLTISENTLVDQLVLHIDAIDPNKCASGSILFSFLPGNDPTEGFRIDTNKGDIYVKNDLSYSKQSVYQLVVNVRGCSVVQPLSTVVNVFIYITEELSNYPSTILRISVSENAAINTVVPTQSMQVWNANKFQLSYEIVFYENSDSSMLKINVQTGDVILIQSLNYEDKNEYIFMRRAVFNGVIYGVQTVNLMIINENNNNPIFDLPTESVTVRVNEHSQVGSCLTLVNASDLDSRSRGKLVFSINPPVAGFMILSIKDMGAIFLEKDLNAEDKTLYQLVLSVSDSEGRSSVNSKIVNIQVIDINNEPPTFAQSEYIFNKLEGPYESSFVGTVVATDKDVTPQNRAISYQIINNDASQVFEIDNMAGSIYLKKELDREMVSKYTFMVEAANIINGQKTLVGNCFVNVIVGDINDHVPTYNGDLIFSFYENIPIGSTLFTIKAEDLDSGPNSELIYSFDYVGAIKASTSTLGLLNVDQVSGRVTLLNNFDYEKATEYILSVNIYDKGSPKNVLNVKFKIRILDVNDNSPRFIVRPQTQLQYSIGEDTPFNYTIDFFTATDSDFNSKINYSLVNVFNSNFAIDPNTGRLYTIGLFDYLVSSQYYLLVVASDNGNPQLSDTIPVVVNIIDLNNQNPVFTQTSYNITILQGTPAGLSIGKVSAIDLDSGQYGLVNYLFKSGRSDLFSIDQLTGNIFTLGQVTVTSNLIDRYEIIVGSQDSDPVSPRSSQDAKVIINALKNNIEVAQPMFYQPYLEIYLREDQSLGMVASTLATVSGGLLNYSIVTDGSQARLGVLKFSVDMQGKIYLNSFLDYEQTQFISFTIKAQIIGSNIFGTQNVLVIVQDVDDNNPVFEGPQQQTVTIPSLVNLGIVAFVKANDADSVSKGKLKFSLINDYGRTFSIVSVNDVGLVILNRILNGESTYLLEVQVQDLAGRTAAQTNFIKVLVNSGGLGSALQFTKTLYNFFIPEYFEAGYNVGYVSGVIYDSSLSGNIEYSIVPADGAENIFSIQNNGSIFSKISFKSKTPYLFSVRANISTLGLTALTWVYVSILPQNKNPIFFSNNRYTIAEDFPTETVVFKVVAIDDSSDVFYSIDQCTGDLVLSINSSTGEVDYKSGLNYEKALTHTCQIKAQDQTMLFSIQTITIYVLNVNEYNPIFIPKFNGKNFYGSSIIENSAAFQPVVTVSATDQDSGIFGIVQYSIVNALTPMPFSVDPSSGSVFTTGLLDFESVKGYEILVMAADGGSPPRTDVISVLVSVIDVNDNFPKFGFSNYTTTVFSNTPIPSIVLLVHATDNDFGNLYITYALASGSNNMFSIDEKTGLISLIGALDYSDISQRYFQIAVTATDYQIGYPSKTVSSIVNINVVEGKNDQIRFVESYKFIELFKNQSVNRILFTTQVVPSNFNVSFSIVQGSSSNNFPFLIDSSGSVYLNQSLVYAVQTEFAFLIKAVKISDRSFSFQSIIVNVLNSNDEKPVFAQPVVRVLNLNTLYTVGQAVSFVSVSDNDSSDFVYSLTPDNVPFKIANNGYVGILYVSEMLVPNSYTFKVSVSDVDITGNLKNKAENDILYNVIVSSVSNVLIRFSQSIYTFNVKEEDNAFKTIGNVYADSENPVKFNLVDLYLKDIFFVNATTGAITVIKSLNYESTKQYIFSISATNDNGYSTSTIVNVIVIDVNDNKPTFKGPSLYHAFESTELGSVLFTVCATDQDSGNNSYLIYSLETNVPQIQVNPYSGDVVLIKKLDYEKSNKIIFSISVSDQGVPQQSSQQVFTLLIGNINDHNPVFNSPEDIIISLREDSNIYTDVSNATATDADAGIYGQIFYSLFGTIPMLPFTILPSGIIKQNSSLDYEKIKTYNFFIQASDGGSPPRIAVKAILINIIDVNDNSPFFTQLFYSIAISDQTPVGAVFLQVTARDYDNSNISYMIVSSGSNNFGIDVQSGSIFVASVLNGNLKSYYDLLVNASDGGPSMASVRVYINVTSSDQPHFATFVQYISLYENAIPQIIGRSLVVNTNSVTYSLEYTDAGTKFSIDPVSGYIYLIGVLDYETQKEYILTVSAANELFSGYQLVRIIVLDVNDNKPYLTPTKQTVTISEATLTSQPFAVLRAFDADSVNKNNLSISISSQFDAFRLEFDNQALAYIYVKKDLHLLAQFQYTIKMVISDGVFATDASVTVNVIPFGQILSDLQFQSFFYTFQVSELKGINEIFGSVLATFYKNTQLPISYSIFEKDLPFAIDSKTGELSLNSTLDFEQTEVYIFHLVASAQDSNQSYAAYSSVVVDVINVNDNGPVFDKPLYVQVIAENYLVGTTVLQVRATDKDIDVNGIIAYSLNVSGVNPFYIDPNTGVVILSKPLDFESRRSYDITLYATDSQYVGTSKLQILVTDSNDNAPIFQKPFQTLLVSEQKANVVLGCILASDNDATTLNNQVMYNLLSADSDYSNAFSVNKSGCIILSAKLDREIQDKYHLTIVANDNGVPSLSGYTEIEVFVYDVNDNTPKLAHSIYNLQISNLVPNGTLLISIQATDGDLGPNSQISYSIVSGNIGSVFSLLSNGDVVTQSSMINNSIAFYQLIVKVEDQGTPSLSSIVTINIAVMGLNIFMPQFDRSVYEVSVKENFIGNIFQLKASIDPSLNLTVRYAVVETSLLGKNKLSIDDMGLISIQRPFDYESAPTYIFIVRAFTVIHPEVFASVVLRLSVNNINDNSPAFKRPMLTVSVARQSKVGTIISTVYAYDADENANSSITYSFPPNQTNQDLFGIDLRSGDITLLREIQFQDIKMYTLMVFAFDSSGKTSSLPATVIVKIYPDNMFKPTFSALPLYYSVSESAALFTVVGNVVAVDNDANLPSIAILERPEAANFGSLFYSILSTSGRVPFSISSLGVLSVSGLLDRETKSIYDLQVQATDGGNPGLSSVKLVTILITDINERPVFVKQNYSIEVMESIPIGFSILAVSARDSDTFSNGIVDYAIVSGNEDFIFKIDTNTGIISTIDYLNFDKKDNYVLEIKAVDQGTQQLTSALNAFVRIKVLNDTREWQFPLFGVSHYEFTVEENTIKSLGPIIATGLHSISYRILNTNDYELFTIENTTGLLIIRNPDFETKNELNIYVESYYDSIPSMTSVINVLVTVLDINDNAPIFVQPQFNVTISEYTIVGDIVAVFNAFDGDSGTNGNVDFGLSPSDIFVISTLNGNTGVIRLNRKLNFVSKNMYILEVSLSDMGIPKFYAPNITFTVFVTTEVTNSLFSLTSASVSINRNTSIGLSIYTLKVQSSVQNKKPLFELINVFGGLINPFKLNPTGWIELVAELEPVDKYILFITVKDQDNPAYLSTLSFTIEIVPDVIFSPYFDPLFYDFVVREDILVGTVINKVLVVDTNAFVKSLTYQIVSGNNGTVFAVNSIGEIIVQQPLDAEKITQYSLSVSVADRYSRAERNATVKISVTDVNDNAPFFLNSSYYKEISENTLVNTSIETYFAIDADSGLNGLLKYKVVDATDTFGMFSNGTLFLKKSLNWYAQSDYTLMVVAFDAGFPSKYTSSIVFISVINVNSPPSFDVTFYSQNILETIEVGSSLLHIQVTDNDEGKNGNVVLNLSKDVESVFEFIGKTLVLKSPLNYSLTSQYAFTIDARDGGNPPLHSNPSAKVNLTIRSISSLQPRFLLTAYKVMDLMENVLYLTPILNVSAFVSGSGGSNMNNGGSTSLGLVYALEGDDSQNFTINSNGSIYSKVVFDHKIKSSYQFNVVAQNSANLSYFDQAVVELLIKDTNDNAPVLSPSIYNYSISDRLPIGTILGRINASDQDSGDNGQLTFFLYNTTNNDFKLIGDLLVVNRMLDSKLQTYYNFCVYATDNGFPPQKSGLGNIVINLYSPNSGLSPTFIRNLYIANVFDNLTSADTLLTVKAIQIDQSTDDAIVYTLDSSSDALRFKINSVTGDISLKQGHRFSNFFRTTLVFYAIATDLLGFSDKAFVVINIKDSSGIDHTRPIFTQAEYITAISESTAVGSNVLTVQAIDTDSIMLTYSILSGNKLNLFSVTSSGAIVVNNNLDISTNSVSYYLLEVSAKDELNKTSVKNAIVRINIVPSSQTVNYLLFENSTYFFSIAENTPAQKLGTVMAQISNGKQEGVRYKVLDLISGFEMKGADLWSSQLFDREKKDRYILQILAYSNTSGSDKALVIVDIIDVNDNDPVFSDTPIKNIILSEFSQVLSIVATVTATDDDSGVNGEVDYELSTQDFFTIDKYGQIMLVKSFTHDTPDIINITVFANNPNSDIQISMQLTVYVMKEQVPQFNKTTYFVSLNETNNTVTIFTLKAISPQVVNYTIKHENNMFEITSSGQIKNLRPIDYELNKYFDLCVEAHGNSIIMSSVTIHIDVLDVNDNAPYPDSFDYEINVSEGSLLNAQIVTVIAHDLDSGSNGELVYEIIESDNKTFSINNKGVITLTSMLDFMKKALYLLKVMIYDKGVPSLAITKPVLVKVNVQKLEDGLLLFASDYDITVNESTSKQYIITVFSNLTGVSIMYKLINYNDIFTINETGQIWSVSGLSYTKQSKYILVVNALANKRSSFIQITINIRGFNHKPFITGVFPLFFVPKNAPIGTLVAQVIAQDPDSPTSLNGMLNYSIILGNDNNIFKLDENGYILTQQLLPVQKKVLYNLSIVVFDNGTPNLRSDIQNFTIQISYDGIIFSNSSYLYTFQENSNISISDIVATDLDNGGPITYSIESLEAQKWFSFGPDSKIYPRKVLDYETWQEFSFIVVATAVSSKAKAVVTILLTNVNDNAPVFYPANYMVMIPINTTVKTNVTTVYATDSEKNTVLVFSLIDATNTFSIDSSGVISTKNKLSGISMYHLLVNVSDNEKSSAIPAHVVVYVNFFPVTFDQRVYQYTPQKNSANMTLGIVRATSEVEVIYSINDYDGQFIIDSKSGKITATKNFDQKIYYFEVTASTKYSNDSAVVVVTVDCNNRPKFVENAEVYLFTPLQAGFVVKTMIASDSNLLNPTKSSGIRYSIKNINESIFTIDDQSGEISLKQNISMGMRYKLTVAAINSCFESTTDVTITFSVINSTCLINSNYKMCAQNVSEGDNLVLKIDIEGLYNNPIYTIIPYQNMFSIDNSGIITNVAQLDYETERSYSFIVEITNGTSTSSVRIPVVINLIDINDNAPEFEVCDYNKTFFNKPLAGFTLLTVLATDADSGDNGVVQFSINSSLPFSINKTTGVIKATSILNMTYIFNVVAQDLGNPLKKSQLPIQISIILAPTCDKQNGMSIGESSVIGTVVGKMIASQTTNETLKYSIIDDLNFTIGITGDIRTNVLLNYTSIQQYYLLVEVANSQKEAQTCVTLLIIDVINELNIPPQFDSNIIEITLPINWPVNVEIVVVNATNLENLAPIQYSLDNSSVFSIDNITGSLTLKQQIKYPATYNLLVVAQIQNSNLKASKPIKIIFTNDNGISNPISVIAQEALTQDSINVNLDLDDFFSNQTWKKFKTINVYVQKFKPGISDVTAYLPPSTWFLTNVATDGTEDYYKTYLALVIVNNQFNITRKRRDIGADGNLQLALGNQTCSVQSDPAIPCNGRLQTGTPYRFQLVGLRDGIKVYGQFSSPLYAGGVSSSLPFNLSGTSLYYIIGLVVLGTIIILLVILLAFAALLYTSHQVPGFDNISLDKVDAGIDWPINKYRTAESYIPRATRVDNPIYSTKLSTFAQAASPNLDEVDTIPRASYKPQNSPSETQEVEINLARSNERQSIYLSGKADPEGNEVPQAPPPPALSNQRLPNPMYNDTTRSTAQPRLARTSSGRVILQQ